ncbi:serine/threonine-protein kinase [Paraliomyxa miuraensis]|uniref:serine/threonine-protein kinase n=1 Tax=Paraliomyxa miuraensis TaxID=376150 RepID=UPI002257BF65|nr:serine/threonine-protein kinase [Paraliomyxa miuraensis]MCX4245026.1 protein kinase [Paraliomyxa miuraensis]
MIDDDVTRDSLPESIRPAPAILGSKFADRYIVRREVGQGGMGTVYAAHDMMLGEVVALKVLRPLSAEDGVVIERFRREVRLARKVAHPNAARTYDIGFHEGMHYLTMELVEGTTLSNVLRERSRLPVHRAVDIAMQICAGLDAAHREKVVHRDLKPGNVLIERRTNRVVITDFGVACMMSAGDLLTGDPNIMIGTPAYMAPEQITSGELGAHTDIYSLGLVLYEMLTGRVPFREATPMATAFARVRHDPENPGEHAKLPPELCEVVLRCLARDPARRPAATRELADLLAPFLHDIGESTLVEGLTRDTLIPTHVPISASFVSIRMGTQSLAVLPMRYRGPESEAYLADSITEQLVDLLSMTRGLKVLSASASARLGENRDPVVVRERLGVGVMVDGSVQRHGDMLRVVARLVNTADGVQVWSERFEGRLEDVLELQDTIANRVAEALRLELDTHRHTAAIPAPAVELYMRARGQARRYDLGGLGPDGAEQLMLRCLDITPDFPPALASLALVLARLWSIHGEGQDGANWPQRCRDAVALALDKAPEQPETHLAAGRMHCEHGHYRAAAEALKEALRLAPTYAAAHASLGALQCETGRSHEGYRHLTTAVELEPDDPLSLLSAARYHAQRGDLAQAEGMLDRLGDPDPTTRGAIAIIRLRMSLWRGRADQVRAQQRTWGMIDAPRKRLLDLLGGVYLGRIGVQELGDALDEAMARDTSPRFASSIHQLATEVLAARGETEAAFEFLRHAARDVLVDVDWLAHCPVLGDLRSREGFAPVVMTVRQRAAVIWAN